MISSDCVNSDLATEKQLVLAAQREIEDPGIFKEELTFLGNENFERRNIEWLKIHFRVSKIGVAREIQDQVGTETVFHIDAAGEREFQVLARLFVIAREPIGLHNKKSSAADVLDAFEVPRLRYLCYPKCPPVRFPQVGLVLSADELLVINAPQLVRGMCEFQSCQWMFAHGSTSFRSDLVVGG